MTDKPTPQWGPSPVQLFVAYVLRRRLDWRSRALTRDDWEAFVTREQAHKVCAEIARDLTEMPGAEEPAECDSTLQYQIATNGPRYAILWTVRVAFGAAAAETAVDTINRIRKEFAEDRKIAGLDAREGHE